MEREGELVEPSQAAPGCEGIELDRYVCARGVEAVFEDRSLGRYFVSESNGEVVDV